jgi:hypothetical protein
MWYDGQPNTAHQVAMSEDPDIVGEPPYGGM